MRVYRAIQEGAKLGHATIRVERENRIYPALDQNLSTKLWIKKEIYCAGSSPFPPEVVGEVASRLSALVSLGGYPFAGKAVIEARKCGARESFGLRLKNKKITNMEIWKGSDALFFTCTTYYLDTFKTEAPVARIFPQSWKPALKWSPATWTARRRGSSGTCGSSGRSRD